MHPHGGNCHRGFRREETTSARLQPTNCVHTCQRLSCQSLPRPRAQWSLGLVWLSFSRVRIFAEHLGGLGKGLRTALDAYNRTIGSYESRLLPGTRRLAELGAGDINELGELSAVDGHLRAVVQEEESTQQP